MNGHLRLCRSMLAPSPPECRFTRPARRRRTLLRLQNVSGRRPSVSKVAAAWTMSLGCRGLNSGRGKPSRTANSPLEREQLRIFPPPLRAALAVLADDDAEPNAGAAVAVFTG